MTQRVFPFALALLVGAALLLVVPAPTARAEHEVELAEGLAYDFRMFDLAEEVLEDYLRSSGLTDAEKSRALLSLMNILNRHADVLEAKALSSEGSERTRLEREAERLREGAGDKLEELKEVGGDMALVGGLMANAKDLLDKAEAQADRRSRQEFVDQAKTLFTQCLEILHPMVLNFDYNPRNANPSDRKPMAGSLLDKWIRGNIDTDTSEGQEQAQELRLAWYYLAECFFNVGKTLDAADRTDHFDRAYLELDELIFEFEDSFVGYYALLLQGDVQLERQNYNAATASYESVLSLPITLAGWSPQMQAQIDTLRMTAYQKTAEAYMRAGNLDRVIQTINQMEADYPTKRNHPRLKVCRIMKGEAMIKAGSAPAGVIESLADFRTDPSAYFRNYYYRMLASVGKFPGLSLDLRVDCARAAFANGMGTDSAQIYQIVLQNLATAYQPGDLMRNGRTADRETDLTNDDLRWRYEKYGPEAYWYLAESLAREWRFTEASLVMLDGVRRFAYLARRYSELDESSPVPEHMRTFDGFATGADVKHFALTCDERAQNLAGGWSPAASQPDMQPPYRVSPSIDDYVFEEVWRSLHQSLLRKYPELGQEDPDALKDQAWNEAWNIYVAAFSQGERDRYDSDYHETISQFVLFGVFPSYKTYIDALELCAKMAQFEYDKYYDGRNRQGTLFPEEKCEFESGERTYRWPGGKGLYEHELELLEADPGAGELTILPGLERGSPLHVEMVRLLTELLKFEERVRDRKLGAACYWYKSQYFYLKYLIGTCLNSRGKLEAIDAGCFDSGSLGRITSAYAEMEKERYLNGNIETQVEIRARMLEFSMASWQVGEQYRNNPWNAEASRGPSLLGAADGAKEMSDMLMPLAADAWTSYLQSYQPFYSNNGDSDDDRDNDAHLRKRFLEIAKWVLYLRFYVNYALGDPDGCIDDVQAFNLLFPSDLRARMDPKVNPESDERDSQGNPIPQLQDWWLGFLKLLYQVYSNRNIDRLRIIDRTLTALYPTVSTLKEDKPITWEECANSIRLALPAEELTVTIDGMIVDLHEYLLPSEGALARMRASNNPVFPILGFDDEGAPVYARLSLPQSQVTREKVIEEFTPLAESNEMQDVKRQAVLIHAREAYRCDLKDYYHDDEYRIVDAMIRHLAGSGDRDDEFLFDQAFTWLLDGYRGLVFAYRDRLSGLLEGALNALVEDAMQLQRDGLAYKYEYIQAEEELWPNRWDPARALRGDDRVDVIKKNYEEARRYYGAGQYQRALVFLQRTFDSLKDGFDPGRFVDGIPPQTLSASRGKSKDEITVRAMLAVTYYRLAVESGDSENSNWEKAKTELDRIYDFIRTMNYIHQGGLPGEIKWENTLKERYYECVITYVAVLEHMAEVAASKNRRDVAFGYYQIVVTLHVLLSKQSPEGSPGERRGWLGWLRTCVKIGDLGSDSKYQGYVEDAIDSIEGWYLIDGFQGNKTIVESRILFMDAEFDTAVDALYEELRR